MDLKEEKNQTNQRFDYCGSVKETEPESITKNHFTSDRPVMVIARVVRKFEKAVWCNRTTYIGETTIKTKLSVLEFFILFLFFHFFGQDVVKRNLGDKVCSSSTI